METTASGRPLSWRMAAASFSYAAMYFGAADVHVPHAPPQRRARSTQPSDEATRSTPKWRRSRWRTTCTGIRWRDTSSADQTTACTIAPSRKRRVSDLSPHSPTHAAAASPPGAGPRSTSPAASDGSSSTPTWCNRTPSPAGAGADVVVRRSGCSASGATQLRTSPQRRDSPALSTASAAAAHALSTPSDRATAAVPPSVASAAAEPLVLALPCPPAAAASAAAAVAPAVRAAAAAASAAARALPTASSAAGPDRGGKGKEKRASYLSGGGCGVVKSSAKAAASSSAALSMARSERAACSCSSRSAPRVTPAP
mmetsp:Transcript_31867/g.101541  ORF Transcript_31867/g.101541 Transcript_31867/m.101541 type:complete len:313 (-) Transcript_31867:733-1671(-)